MLANIIINPIPAFDATFDAAINFQYSGNQAVKNRLIIYDNRTRDVVYDSIVESFRLSHVIPAGSLINGEQYLCTITAYDINDIGTTSGEVLFLCFESPTWDFHNLEADKIINNPSFTLEMHYQQNQGEMLLEYEVLLYSADLYQIWNSGKKYSNDLNVEIINLSDNGKYYIRAIGVTVNGMNLDTGFVPFSVEYRRTALYSVLIPENKEFEGIVKLTSNIIIINGKSEPENIEYIDDNFVNLLNGERVYFDEGFELDGNYTLSLLGYGFQNNKEILKIGDSSDGPLVTWRESIFKNDLGERYINSHAELLIERQPRYVIFSEYISPPAFQDIIHVWIRRYNGLYSIKISNRGDVL